MHLVWRPQHHLNKGARYDKRLMNIITCTELVSILRFSHSPFISGKAGLQNGCLCLQDSLCGNLRFMTAFCMQSWDQDPQPLFGNSPSPDYLSECRPAPPASLAKVFCDHGAAECADVMDSGGAPVSGSKMDQTSRTFHFEASRISRNNACGAVALRSSSTVLPQPQQLMASCSHVEDAVLADAAADLNEGRQSLGLLHTGDMGGSSSPPDACTTETGHALPQPDSALISPGGDRYRFRYFLLKESSLL